MRRPMGRRSLCNSKMVLSWTCSHNHFNPVDRRELFDIPRFVCGHVGCKEQFQGDFDFSMSSVVVNGRNLVGKPLDQKDEDLSVPFAYGKQMQITKNMKALIQNKPLSDSFLMNPYHLEKSFQDIHGELPESELARVIVMGQILQTKGICSKDRKAMYKASNVSTIRRNDTPGIVAALADGFPLNAAFCPGRRLKEARYCRPYKPPSIEKMSAKFEASVTQTSIPAHVVVLVGARRISGKLDYYFMNSWKDFCVRRDSNGRVIRGHDGVGKIDANRLIRNVIRISRFKEAPTERSLVIEHLPLDFVNSPNVRLLLD